MSEFKKKERALLMTICREEKVPFALGEQLLKTAETSTYEINTTSSRVKKYSDLITYHYNKKNG